MRKVNVSASGIPMAEIKWAVSQRFAGMPIAGRGGTGEPSICGEEKRNAD